MNPDQGHYWKPTMAVCAVVHGSWLGPKVQVLQDQLNLGVGRLQDVLRWEFWAPTQRLGGMIRWERASVATTTQLAFVFQRSHQSRSRSNTHNPPSWIPTSSLGHPSAAPTCWRSPSSSRIEITEASSTTLRLASPYGYIVVYFSSLCSAYKN